MLHHVVKLVGQCKVIQQLEQQEQQSLSATKCILVSKYPKGVSQWCSIVTGKLGISEQLVVGVSYAILY